MTYPNQVQQLEQLKYLDLANFGKLATNVRGCEHELKKCTGKLKKMF